MKVIEASDPKHDFEFYDLTQLQLITPNRILITQTSPGAGCRPGHTALAALPLCHSVYREPCTGAADNLGKEQSLYSDQNSLIRPKEHHVVTEWDNIPVGWYSGI